MIYAIPGTGHGNFAASFLSIRSCIILRTWLSPPVFLVCMIHAGQCSHLDEPAALSTSISALLVSAFGQHVKVLLCARAYVCPSQRETLKDFPRW